MSYQDTFTIGSLVTDCLIFEGDGTRPIHEENVHVFYDPDVVLWLPEEVQRWRREIEEQEAAKQAAGDNYRWNNPRFAVKSVTPRRTSHSEEPVAHLHLVNADYYDFLATTTNLDRRLEDGSGATLRSRYLDIGDPAEAEAFLSCSFGVNVAAETGPDQKMIFARRSGKVDGVNVHRWNSSANEGLARIHDLPADGSRISLHAAARRALKEEMAVQFEDNVELELLGFGLDLKNHQWAAFFRAVLLDLTEDDLRHRWAKGIEDRWEHEAHAFVPATADDVCDFILGRPNLESAWTPCAPALFYLALVRRAVLARGGDPSGRLDVDAAERRAMSRLANAESTAVAGS
ncbi:translation initiation factor 2 [Streptomyces sp. NPDC058691]|uniref:translation initiation factor 2 n=1 Tax=Streptomyces sp. NPDC058691 TaxID=3346601 RepID=UPI003657DB24